MSKALIYGVVSSIVAVGVSATYFFPFVENLNSIFQGETIVKENKTEVTSSLVEATSSITTESEVQNTDLILDHPQLVIDEDSIKKLSNSKSEDNPTKTKLLEGEIPVTKNY